MSSEGLVALTAALQAAATIVLVGITAWYARVNRDLLTETQQARRDQFVPVLWLRGVPDAPQRNFEVKRVNGETARSITIEGLTIAGTRVVYARARSPFATSNVREEIDKLYHDMTVSANDYVGDKLPIGVKGQLEEALDGLEGVQGFIGVIRYTSLAGERLSSAGWRFSVQGRTTPQIFDGADFQRSEESLRRVLAKWGPEIRKTAKALREG